MRRQRRDFSPMRLGERYGKIE